MLPIVVAAVPAGIGRRGFVGVSLQPVFNNVVIKLLGPEEPRVRLAGDISMVRGKIFGDARVIKRIGFGNTLLKYISKSVPKLFAGGAILRKKPQADLHLLAGGNFRQIVRRHFASAIGRVDGRDVSVNDEIVKRIFYIRRVIGR